MAVVFNATYRFSMKAMMYDLNKIKKTHFNDLYVIQYCGQ